MNVQVSLLFLHQLTHNLLSYCVLVDATISPSEKDLPVPELRNFSGSLWRVLRLRVETAIYIKEV